MRTLRFLFSAACLALALGFIGLGFICVANPHRPLLYLIDIFTLPIWAAAIGFTVFFAVVREVRAAVASVLGVALLTFALAPQVFPKQAPAADDAKPIRMVWGNMLVANPQPDKILPWLVDKQADVVAMVEVNPQTRSSLIAALKDTYPHMAVRYDMLIASKYPIEHSQPRPAGFDLLTVTIDTPKGPLNLAITHLTRPWPFVPAADQPRQFARLADALTPLPGSHFVLAGDFNTTPGAAQLHAFAEKLNLHPAAGLSGTWRDDLPALMRIGIDNVLAGQDLNLSHREVGPDDGSDHRPVYVEIRMAKMN